MNAQELTTVVNEHSDKLVGLRADVHYLLEDLKTDVKMMEDSRK